MERSAEFETHHKLLLLETLYDAGLSLGSLPDEEARAAGLRAMYPLSSGSSHWGGCPLPMGGPKGGGGVSFGWNSDAPGISDYSKVYH